MEHQTVFAHDTIVGILLAAGKSTRFGSNKLCHPLHDDVPLALCCAKNLYAGIGAALVVIRPDDNILRSHLERAQIPYTLCSNTREEMASSLASGIAATGDAKGWVIALGDMPFIQPQTIAAVGSALRNNAILAAPYIGDHRGHPVGFSASLKQELLSLTGDEGGRSVLAKYAKNITRINCMDAGIQLDIDVPADIQIEMRNGDIQVTAH